MSDRRPENTDYLAERSRKAVTPDELEERLAMFDELGVDWQYRNVPEFMFDFVAAARDLLAVVRRGVESGTIKGEGRRMCDAHDDVEAYKNPDACRAGLNANDEAACVMVDYLVIPVSDGGSET